MNISSRLRLSCVGSLLCRRWRKASLAAGLGTIILACTDAPPVAVSGYAGWKYRRRLNVLPGSAMSDCQVRIDISSADFDFSKAQPSGEDFRVALGKTNEPLPYWIERWTSTYARVWVRVPSMALGGTRLWMYYGNPSATTSAVGSATFDFFDDFSSTDSTAGYFQLSQKEIVLTQAPPPSWENTAPHTMSVVEANSSGYRYWGYYGLQGCNGYIGLAQSNDLSRWKKLDTFLSFSEKGDRWPSVLLVDGTYYMVHTKAFCGASYLVLRTSTDGLNFTSPAILVPQEKSSNDDYYLNQGQALFRDPVSGNYFLYWFRGRVLNRQTSTWEIRVKSAATVQGLASASSTLLMDYPTVFAAPQVMYYDGTYYMAVETMEGGVWRTRLLTSDAPDGQFTEIAGNPILSNGSACVFQHVFGNALHAYSCEFDGTTWTLGHRTADLAAGRMHILGPATERWRPTGGEFAVVPGTRPDGTTGLVLQGKTPQNHMLLSSYTGTDYTLEAYGKQVQGRVWGLGIQAYDSANLISINVYEDLDTTNNLYVYAWNNNASSSASSELGKAAVGTVNLGTWYKLTAKVSGTSLKVLFDDREVLQTNIPIAAPGHVAIYGSLGTVVQVADFRVRKYTETEPNVAIGFEQLLF